MEGKYSWVAAAWEKNEKQIISGSKLHLFTAKWINNITYNTIILLLSNAAATTFSGWRSS